MKRSNFRDKTAFPSLSHHLQFCCTPLVVSYDCGTRLCTRLTTADDGLVIERSSCLRILLFINCSFSLTLDYKLSTRFSQTI